MITATQKTAAERLRQARLYCITPSPVPPRTYPELVEAACNGGADAIQLRNKDLDSDALVALARKLRPICRRYGALFIVNDRLDVALACEADGAHLGQDDLPVREARRLVHGLSQTQTGLRDFLIGCSTHSLDQALKAEADGADYVGCGPIFPTPTKPGRAAVGLDLVRQYRERLKIPFVAIGGLEPGNLKTAVDAGAECVAVVRAAFAAPDVEAAVRSLKSQILAAAPA